MSTTVPLLSTIVGVSVLPRPHQLIGSADQDTPTLGIWLHHTLRRQHWRLVNGHTRKDLLQRILMCWPHHFALKSNWILRPRIPMATFEDTRFGHNGSNLFRADPCQCFPPSLQHLKVYHLPTSIPRIVSMERRGDLTSGGCCGSSGG
jgi:hypothetical protein